MHEIRIGYVLKRALRDQRKTLKIISRETGIPYSTLHTWHENRQPKDILKAQKLAEYLGLSLHQLLFDEPDPRESSAIYRLALQNGDPVPGHYEIVVRRLE